MKSMQPFSHSFATPIGRKSKFVGLVALGLTIGAALPLTAFAATDASAQATVSFSPANIQATQTSTLTITINNVTGNVNGLSISDDLSAGGASMVVASSPSATNTCGGSFTPAASDTSLSLAGGSVANNGTCSISVLVTDSVAETVNNTASVAGTNFTAGFTSTAATLTVTALPVRLQSFDVN